ncbi:MAG TPA: hypothetical protein VKG26_05275, partial [Bacteroidia bacterium]|nr:hypothetical protein [Bacteroidia bacterium]
MRVLILCVWLVLTQHTWAQPNTKQLFYNLPVEMGELATQDSLLHDTLNFETKKVYRSKNNQLITINTYYAKTSLNFYTPNPEHCNLTIENAKSKTDTASIPQITLYLNYFTSSSRKKVKEVYYKIINYLVAEYAYNKPQYIKGISWNNDDYKHKWTVHERTTYFYTNKVNPN